MTTLISIFYIVRDLVTPPLAECIVLIVLKYEGLGWGAKPLDVWGRKSPAGSRNGAPLGGLGHEVPQKLKNFKSSYKQILRISGSFSHILS